MFLIRGQGLGASTPNNQSLYEETRIFFCKLLNSDVQGRVAEGVPSL